MKFSLSFYFSVHDYLNKKLWTLKTVSLDLQFFKDLCEILAFCFCYFVKVKFGFYDDKIVIYSISQNGRNES